MLIFGNDTNIRGCFMVKLLKSSASRGAVLKLPNKRTLPAVKTNYQREPMFVLGFSFSEREGTSFVKTFGGRVYSYAFGHDPIASVMSVDLYGFLINGSQYSQVVTTFTSAYQANRISKLPRYAKLGLGSTTPLRGFIVGLDTSTADPEISLQRFTIHMALVEAQ